ncbi:MAG: transcriptional regulator, TetR family [Verrucomicrobiaceae bacterium]|nr:transcriptional regulator, TetR family [Verrucomicrobiaceae bacterium]
MPETKRKLLDASVTLMRTKGFNGTSVDDICTAAGVTKGGFFHYFKSKEEVAKNAAGHFRDSKVQDYGSAPFRKLADPLDRVFGRLEFMVKSAVSGSSPTLGCLIGTLAQELSFTHPEMRAVLQESFARMSRDFEKDLAEAQELYAVGSLFNASAVTSMFIAMYQGSLLMAKASGSNEVLVKNVDEFRSYLRSLFPIWHSSSGMAL